MSSCQHKGADILVFRVINKSLHGVHMLPYSENNKLTVVNFFGGPGCGKSSYASGLFHHMKITGRSVEYVPEVAKDYTWEGRHQMLTEQDYIFAKQNNRLRRLVGQVECVVSDSPLLLGLMYMPADFPASFKTFVIDAFRSYNNVNILLTRSFRYVAAGRNQTEEEAALIDRNLELFLQENDIRYTKLPAADITYEHLTSLL
jgi:hypothetical protein